MRWQGRRGSSNVEDRRGRRMAAGGRIGGLGLIIVVLAGLFFGVDLTPLLNMGGMGGGPTVQQAGPSQQTPLTPEQKEIGQFFSVVLADTEEVWATVFADDFGESYAPPTLVLFSGVTQSACGMADAATGPFYCPPDRKVYLDTDFFQIMRRQLGAGGDFAQAYVVAHEVAHHVQNLLGILPKVNQIRQQVSEQESNALSVRVELQADCLSGVWARRAQENLGSLERGDIEEALNAASQIGDDTLQRNAGRAVVPDSFQHGSSEQRMTWFARGYERGDSSDCDTFGADRI
jgi:uncharacterized protein